MKERDLPKRRRTGWPVGDVVIISDPGSQFHEKPLFAIRTNKLFLG